MKPRLRLVVDNTRPLPEPSWMDIHREEIVERALYMLRNVRIGLAEKERLVRKAVAEDEEARSL